MPESTTNAQTLENIVTRTFDAPRALVYKAWTNPEALAKWWGPKGFELVVATCDVRPGGRFHYCSRNEQMTMWGLFVYEDVTAPETLSFVNSFSDEEGNVIRAPFNANWPLRILNLLTFTEENGKTTLVMRGGPVDATPEEAKTFAEARPMIEGGFKGTFEQLDAYLASVKE